MQARIAATRVYLDKARALVSALEESMMSLETLAEVRRVSDDREGSIMAIVNELSRLNPADMQEKVEELVTVFRIANDYASVSLAEDADYAAGVRQSEAEHELSEAKAAWDEVFEIGK